MTPEVDKLYFQFRTLKQPLDDGFFTVLHAFQGGNMHEIIKRIDARIKQVNETWVKDVYQLAYLDALLDIRLVAESIIEVEEEINEDA